MEGRFLTYTYLIWPYLSTPSGQTYVITPLILIVKPKVVYSSNPKRAVFSTIKIKLKQVHEDSDYCNRSSWLLAKPWKKKKVFKMLQEMTKYIKWFLDHKRQNVSILYKKFKTRLRRILEYLAIRCFRQMKIQAVEQILPFS